MIVTPGPPAGAPPWFRRRGFGLLFLALPTAGRPILVSILATMREREKTRTPAVIPDKLYFRIGDVARICGVETYVLRFWETEFPQLKPGKSGTGQRLYRRRDVELALRIKTLLHDQGYTIAGARQAFKSERDAVAAAQTDLPFLRGREDRRRLDTLRTELRALAAMLDRNGRTPPNSGKSPRQSSARRQTVHKMPAPELF